MEILKELISISLTSSFARKESLKPGQENYTGLTYQLYEGIKNGHFSTDEEASLALYGGKNDGFKFNVLKLRLKEKLYDAVLFLKPYHDKCSFAENYLYCHKYYVVAKLLLYFYASKSGLQLLKKILPKAQEFELHEIVLFCSLTLRKGSIQTAKRDDFNYYSNIYRKTLEIIQAEAEAEELFLSVLFNFTKGISCNPALLAEAEKITKQVKELKEKYNTYELNFRYIYIRYIFFHLNNECAKAMEACNEYEAYLEQNPKLVSKTRQARFLLLKMSISLYAWDYAHGKDCFEKALPLHIPGCINWFLLHEQYFALLLKNRMFAEAGQIMKTALTHKNLHDQPRYNQEIWTIYCGFLWFILSYKEEIKLRDQYFNGIAHFNYKTFLRSVPIYSKDKSGFNICILVLQFLMLLLRNEKERLQQLAENLKYYLNKHLKQDETYRSQAFIRILIRAAESNLNTL